MALLQFTATIQGTQITADKPFPAGLQGRVRVTVEPLEEIEYDDSDLTPEQWNRGISRLMAADFANEPDIYTWEDGEPFNIEDYKDEAHP